MFSRVPFVGFVVFFITGILFEEYGLSELENVNFFLIPILLTTGAISLSIYFGKSSHKIGLSFSLFLLVAGALASVLQNNRIKSELNALGNSRYSSYEAIVKTLPEKRTKSIRMEILVTRIREKDAWVNKHVQAVVSIPIDAQIVPRAGDYLLVHGFLERPNKALNPKEFDYQRYLWNKGFVWTDYLPEETFSILPSKRSSRPALWAISIAQWADSTFRTNITNERAYGLVKAMLLGRRDDLGIEQVDDFTASGTVHILSVSGMHVAIIFLVISWSLGWLKRWPIGRFVYLFTVVFLLCFYALITGLPPSVQRATLMFIVFVVAEAFGRKQSSLNTLAISALLILAVDPRALYDLGFQLSYLAMTGIFTLYEPIDLIFKPTNRILKFVWQVSAMAFAAQLATFPLSVFYFHQFPTYFWLVNPFVIFFTNVLLPSSMILLLVSLFHITWLQIVANAVVTFSAYLTNLSVALPKSLPVYIIENLYLDRMEVVLMYVFMSMVCYAYYKQEYLLLKRSLAIAVLFVIYSLSQSIQTYYSSIAIIHSVPKHSVLTFKEGNKLFISSDEAFRADATAYKFHVKNYAISAGVTDTIYLPQAADYASGSLMLRYRGNRRIHMWKGLSINLGKDISKETSLNYSLITSPITFSSARSRSSEVTTFLFGGEIRGRRLEKSKDNLARNGGRFYDLSAGYLLLQ